MSTADVYGRARVPLVTPAGAAEADRLAQTRFGVPERVLMENAGSAAALVLQRLYPDGRVVGIAGSGNNGGDLLVMLRTLHGWGRDVCMIPIGSTAPDAALAHAAQIPTVTQDADARTSLAHADVVVDGMLGTGADGAPRGRVAEWIGLLNATPRPVLALDLPSGVDAGTGHVDGVAVRADATVCFGWPKLGLMLQPARAHCGHIYAVEIGFPAGCLEPTAWAITPGLVRDRLRERAPDAHKGSAGRLLALAGSDGMAGAAALTVGAALRAGAGLVRVASTPGNRAILQTLVPEATFLDAASIERDDVEPMHAVVAGTGLGTRPAAAAALARVLELTGDTPLLLDADALNILARDDGALATLGAGRALIITPHARELHRLTGTPIDEILADPVGAARAAAAAFHCIVLLKGQPSLVAAEDGTMFVNTTGSSDTAAAGMGDQLAGTIAALLAGAAEPLDAAVIGLFLSGRAADLAARGRALSPRDVTECMHDAFARPGTTEPVLDLPFIEFSQPPRR
ncbi:bifunctional ADP-dependent NAD(P)H-hydrate dehydratase/NAD(P)H-hydrate epimerase [soil metagenome]